MAERRGRCSYIARRNPHVCAPCLLSCFAGRKAAHVLRQEWTSLGDGNGMRPLREMMPCTLPDNNALGSFQNAVFDGKLRRGFLSVERRVSLGESRRSNQERHTWGREFRSKFGTPTQAFWQLFDATRACFASSSRSDGVRTEDKVVVCLLLLRWDFLSLAIL